MAYPSFFSTEHTLGILGGGQLGKMLLQCTRTWDIRTKVLDPDPQAPARLSCNEFVQGDLKDFDTVYAFGQGCDVLTIEIEHVNTEALRKLKAEGVIVHPDPEALTQIKDKGLQKMFYQLHGLPSSDFALHDNEAGILHALEKGLLKFPFVQKARTEGYDGRGVSIIRSEKDLDRLLPGPCLVEDCIDIQTEIAVIACRNARGEVVCFDPVSMDVHPEANLLDLLLYPAPVSSEVAQQARELAAQLIARFDICGLLAVEFMVDRDNKVWINEVAPRPHNSGHQTIESSVSSQYEQHLRGILNLPLGSSRVKFPSAMVNLLGDEGYQGPVDYQGLEEVLGREGVFVHLYGKTITKPFRKMGHVTVTAATLEEAKQTAQWVKQRIKVRSRS